MPSKSDFILLTGSANQKLAEDIGKILKMPVYNPVNRFADNEANVQIPLNVRKREVFIIQSTCPPNVDSSYMELFLMIDAARKASASEITVILPYYGYSRQDRKDRSRVPISSALMANLLEHVGADKIVTIDIHSDQQQGFSRGPWDTLYASYTLLPLLKNKLDVSKLIIASPDKGGVLIAAAYANRLGAEGIAIVYKERDITKPNSDNTRVLGMVGEVAGKDVLLVDDMIDTAGTLCNAAEKLKEAGAKKITAAATHGIFSDPALKRISECPIDKVYITDTVALRKEVLEHPKIEVISVAPLLAEAIERIYTGDSLSEKLFR